MAMITITIRTHHIHHFHVYFCQNSTNGFRPPNDGHGNVAGSHISRNRTPFPALASLRDASFALPSLSRVSHVLATWPASYRRGDSPLPGQPILARPENRLIGGPTLPDQGLPRPGKGSRMRLSQGAPAGRAVITAVPCSIPEGVPPDSFARPQRMKQREWNLL